MLLMSLQKRTEAFPQCLCLAVIESGDSCQHLQEGHKTQKGRGKGKKGKKKPNQTKKPPNKPKHKAPSQT